MEGNTKLDLLMKVPNETDIAPVNLYFGIHRSNNKSNFIFHIALTTHTIRPDSTLTSEQHRNKKNYLKMQLNAYNTFERDNIVRRFTCSLFLKNGISKNLKTDLAFPSLCFFLCILKANHERCIQSK